MSEANSESLLLFIKFQMVFAKKLPLRTERKRSSIEFEHSENIGQFFKAPFYLFLNLLNILGTLKGMRINAFRL